MAATPASDKRLVELANSAENLQLREREQTTLLAVKSHPINEQMTHAQEWRRCHSHHPCSYQHGKSIFNIIPTPF